MVADPPEKHLRRHALIDAVQQLLDEAGAGFGDHDLQRTPAIKLPLLGTEPVPPAIAVPEDLFRKGGNTGEAYRSIRFVPAQGLLPRAAMRQRAPGHDERVDLVVGQTRLAEPVDHSRGEAILDQLDEVLLGAQPVQAEHLFNPFQQARPLRNRSLDDHSLGQEAPLSESGNMPAILWHFAKPFKPVLGLLMIVIIEIDSERRAHRS